MIWCYFKLDFQDKKLILYPIQISFKVRVLTSKWKDLFLSNFLGVFNDNLLKNAIIFIAVGWNLPDWMSQSQLISIVSASLVLPYLVFSPLGGKLSVIYHKITVFRFLKLIEMPIMLIACFSFYYEWVYVSIFSVLLMGIQSSLYSPSKYGLIKDIGGEKGVSEGSGGFETMAFLGILLGTFVASLLADIGNHTILYIVFLGVAFLGYLVTLQISVQEESVLENHKHKLNPFSFFRHGYHVASHFPQVNLAVVGASVFWLLGSVLQMNLVIHSRQFYEVSATSAGIVMGVAAIGIAFGTWVAGVISGERVERGLILLGLTGMLLILVLVLFVSMSFVAFVVLIFIFAFFGGLFQVPNLAIIQGAGLGRNIGTIIAYLNLLTFILILLGTLIFSATTSMTNENSFAVFGVLALICLVFVLYYAAKHPVFLKASKSLLQSLWGRKRNIR